MEQDSKRRRLQSPEAQQNPEDASEPTPDRSAPQIQGLVERLSSDHAVPTSAASERFTTLKDPDSLEKGNSTSAQFIETEKKNPADFYKFLPDNIPKALPVGNPADAINNVQWMASGGEEKIAANYFDDLDDSGKLSPPCLDLPDEAYEKLNGVCEKFKLSRPQVTCLPDYGVRIVGKNVETAKLEFIEALEGFGLKYTDVRNSFKNKHGYTVPQSYEVAKMMLESGMWTSKGKSHCELFLLAEDRKSGEEVRYAVVPAHLILTKKQTSDLDCMNVDISVIREDFEQQTGHGKYVFTDEKDAKSHDLLEPQILLAYRYWSGQTASKTAPSSDAKDVRCPDKDSYPVMNDMALLKLKHLPKNTSATMLNIFSIPTKKHLDLLAERQQTILVGDLEGRLIYCPRSLGNGVEQYGLHLAYIITSKDSDGKTRKLEEGDSGLIVYLRGKHGKRFPVGMHVGKYSEDMEEFDSEIYQAVVLSHALKEIKHEYQHVISNLRQLETGHPYDPRDVPSELRKMKMNQTGIIYSKVVYSSTDQ